MCCTMVGRLTTVKCCWAADAVGLVTSDKEAGMGARSCGYYKVSSLWVDNFKYFNNLFMILDLNFWVC